MSEDVQQRITAAFLVFDEENIKAVDSREVAVIVRSLGELLSNGMVDDKVEQELYRNDTLCTGCCPTESEMASILLELEDPETPGSVHLERFLPLMTRIIAENRY